MNAASQLNPHIITFVGAGPGAADLITVRGMHALQVADVVLYDALIDPELLNHCSKDVLRVDVGKRCGLGRSRPQDDINALLVEYGLQFKNVVRLKGGDPSIFGRLDEELGAVRAVGLQVEIIPGVTSALAAAAAAQTPLTRRGVARSVRLMTASIGEQQPAHAWGQTIDPSETLVFYMAGRQIQQIGVNLLAHGFAADTPVLLMRGVSWADQVEQRLVLSDLPNMTTDAAAAPAVLLVGMALRL